MTYAEWARKDDANPITYPSLTREMMIHFRQSGTLFARKFPSNAVTVDQWNYLLSQVPPLPTLTGRPSRRLPNSPDSIIAMEEPTQLHTEPIPVVEPTSSPQQTIEIEILDRDSLPLQTEPSIEGTEINSEENQCGQARPSDRGISDEDGPAKQKPRLE